MCRTDISNPSQSLSKSICYLETFSFTSKQTEWGHKHEKQAWVKYEIAAKQSHKILENGLFINPQWPSVGASPDGIATCEYCTSGVLEFKCPYFLCEESIKSASAR